MPRDAHLLAPHTQALLREARKPRFAKRKADTADDDKHDDDDDGGDKLTHSGWVAKKWTLVPAQAEKSEPDYLAKRRKGLPNLYGNDIPPMITAIATRKAKVRKTDAEGNATIYEVIVPEGQPVVGEVVDEDVSMTDAPVLAPGTVEEGVGVANAEGLVVANDLLQPTPPRRRKMPPPPRRRGGPGRGKKKVMFQRIAPPSGPTQTLPTMDGFTAAVSTEANGTVPKSTPAPTDAENAANDQNEDEEGEEGEDGDDGEDGEDDEGEEEDDDREDGELSDAENTASAPASIPPSELTQSEPPADGAQPADVPMHDQVPTPLEAAPSPTETAPIEADVATTDQGPTVVEETAPAPRDQSSSPDLPLARGSHGRTGSPIALLPGGSPATTVEDEAIGAADPERNAGETAVEVSAIDEPTDDTTRDDGTDAKPAGDDVLGKFEQELEKQKATGGNGGNS